MLENFFDESFHWGHRNVSEIIGKLKRGQKNTKKCAKIFDIKGNSFTS